MKFILLLIPFYLVSTGCNVFSSNKNIKKFKETNNVKNSKSYWYWIDEKYCFPQNDYCIDSFYFHYDSLSDNISLENIDNYIPDSITKIFRIKKILIVNLDNEKNKALPQFINMYNLISYLKHNKYELKNNIYQKRKYIETFPVKISYFFSFHIDTPHIIQDTFQIKNNMGIIGNEEIKVFGELKIFKFKDAYLNNLNLKKEIDDSTHQNIYLIYNNNVKIELKLRPLNNKKYIRLK